MHPAMLRSRAAGTEQSPAQPVPAQIPEPWGCLCSALPAVPSRVPSLVRAAGAAAHLSQPTHASLIHSPTHAPSIQRDITNKTTATCSQRHAAAPVYPPLFADELWHTPESPFLRGV